MFVIIYISNIKNEKFWDNDVMFAVNIEFLSKYVGMYVDSIYRVSTEIGNTLKLLKLVCRTSN